MIAVFSKNEKEFKSMHFSPKEKFKRIKSIDDIRGINFEGVILMHGYYEASDIVLFALDAFKERHINFFLKGK